VFTKSLPNIFTIANLFLGIIAILLVFDNRPDLAAMMVIIAMVTDGLDGRVARALNVQSEFGKELDSLSDVISFGVAPAFIMYVVAFQEIGAAGWIVTAIFPICGALRLARFNVVTGTPGYFIGLPIPAAGGALSTLALFASDVAAIILLLSVILLSYLMVSNVKYPSFKKGKVPKVALWITPIVIVVVVVLAIQYKGIVTKLLFVPLVLYALYGLKKNVSLALRLLRIKKKREESTLDDSVRFRDV
jgi:CDP-diacylglycerol--serine O-phosphatidyltransferase